MDGDIVAQRYARAGRSRAEQRRLPNRTPADGAGNGTSGAAPPPPHPALQEEEQPRPAPGRPRTSAALWRRRRWTGWACPGRTTAVSTGGLGLGSGNRHRRRQETSRPATPSPACAVRPFPGPLPGAEAPVGGAGSLVPWGGAARVPESRELARARRVFRGRQRRRRAGGQRGAIAGLPREDRSRVPRTRCAPRPTCPPRGGERGGAGAALVERSRREKGAAGRCRGGPFRPPPCYFGSGPSPTIRIDRMRSGGTPSSPRKCACFGEGGFDSTFLRCMVARARRHVTNEQRWSKRRAADGRWRKRRSGRGRRWGLREGRGRQRSGAVPRGVRPLSALGALGKAEVMGKMRVGTSDGFLRRPGSSYQGFA